MARAKKNTVLTLGAELAGATSDGWKGGQFVPAGADVAIRKIVAESDQALALEVNRVLDTVRSGLKAPLADLLKGNAKTSDLRRELGAFALVAFSGKSESTAKSYGSGMIAALELGIAWSTSTHKEAKNIRAERAAAKEAERIKAGGKPREPSKSGPVCRTSWAAALKTAERLAEQLGMLQAGAQMVKSAEALKTKVAAKVAAK